MPPQGGEIVLKCAILSKCWISQEMIPASFYRWHAFRLLAIAVERGTETVIANSRNPKTFQLWSGQKEPIFANDRGTHHMKSTLWGRQQAALQLAVLTADQKNAILMAMANALREQADHIIEGNAKDLRLAKQGAFCSPVGSVEVGPSES